MVLNIRIFVFHHHPAPISCFIHISILKNMLQKGNLMDKIYNIN